MKKQIVIGIVLLGLGFFIGLKQGPEKVETTEEIEQHKNTITQLQLKIEKLSEESLKENVRTVIIEKPDGTKITTKVRNTETLRKNVTLSNKTKIANIIESTKTARTSKTTYRSNHNAFGVRPSFVFNSNQIKAEIYFEAGVDCLFIFECYVEGAYEVIDKGLKVSAGFEYRF